MAKERLSIGACALAFFSSFAPVSSVAQSRPPDLPPPPGALARELDHGSALPRDGAIAPGGGPPVLSKPIVIPFAYENSHIIVQASIDGGPPLPFAFDTGSRTLFTKETAQGLEAATKTSRWVGGVGRKNLEARVIEVRQIAIGAATFHSHTVMVLDLPNGVVDRGSRERLAGLIGSELLVRFAVTIDFKNRFLILNAPGFRPPSAQFALPLGMAISPDGLSHPSTSVELDGIAGDFILDTGAAGEVSVSDAFQKLHAPFAGHGKILRFLSAGGIGGHVNVMIGFGNRLRLGSLTLSPPLVVGSTDDRGFSTPANIAGIIGNEILALFVVTIDLQSGRIYFDPIDGRKLPTAFGGSGLILDKPNHEAFEVLDVLEGSAAKRAGLRRGDLIVEVDGRPARDLSLGDALAPSRSRKFMAVVTGDQRRLDLAIEKLLP